VKDKHPSAGSGAGEGGRGGCTLQVKVYPRAGRSGIDGVDDTGTLRVRVAAAPEKGKANKELIRLLSRALGVAAGRIEIRKGMGSRAKRVFIEGLDAGEAVGRIKGREKGRNGKAEC